jgi:hypothetical protein
MAACAAEADRSPEAVSVSQRWSPVAGMLTPNPTGTGRKRWVTRWEAAFNAFEITFEGRLTATQN